MAEKIFNSRLIHKHDIESNWLKAVNFTPKQGEIIVYDIDDNYNYERFKIGDGITLVNSLPFADDSMKTYVDASIAAIPTEQWTFTLENGSTVTKKVVVIP